MKALFTDLDGTVIFTRRTCGPNGTDGLTTVEHYKGRPLSYMTAEAHRLATQLDAAGVLVPVTTRSVDQLRRIEVFTRSRLFISDNGGQVVVDGVPDPEWVAHIANLMPAGIEAHERLLSEELVPRGWRVRFTGFMISVAAPAGTPADELLAVASSRPFDGAGVHVHGGRKLHWIPDGMTKGAAARFVAEKFGLRITVAAGDGFLDLPLLAEAETSVALAGTAIVDQVDVRFGAGAPGGEQILAYAASRVGPGATSASDRTAHTVTSIQQGTKLLC